MWMQCRNNVITQHTTKRLLHELAMRGVHARQTDIACVDGGGIAIHGATSSALRLLNGVMAGGALRVAPGYWLDKFIVLFEPEPET
jgi:hypothetical protein